MKAAQYNSYGSIDVLQVVDDAPKPDIQPGHVLIEVQAASINPFDTIIMAGYLKDMIPLKFPVTIGGDIAGTVVAVASDIKDIKVGQNVYGQANIVAGGSGAIAQYCSVEAGRIGLMPKAIDFTQAASLPLVGVSAIQGINEALHLQKDQRILILGAAGGIGTIAMQLAHHVGAYVIAVARGEQNDFLSSLGANEIVSPDELTTIPTVDCMFDLVGGTLLTNTLHTVKPGGIIATMKRRPDTDVNEVTVEEVHTNITTSYLATLSALIENNSIKPCIDKVFPLDQVQEAYTKLSTGHPRGKIVISIK